MMRTAFSFVAAVLLGIATVHAQKVGVVMSGGGAKGLYHIGVLQALEENGIPIDYVSGTSMGSIVAAMYAAGYSPAEMRAIVESGVVKEWLSGRIDPNYMPYYRQMNRIPAFMRLRLDFKSSASGRRFMMPTNLLSSTPVDMALLELFAPATAAAAGDFNHLMVPFLCVASDMNARRAVVLRSGDLAEAVRSSMSIPLVFKPVKKDSMLLYDGGIYDNFPWKPLDEDFHPDFIVGSICTAGNTPPSENNNLMDQAFVLAMHDTDYSLPAGRSLEIRRAVPFNMLDFDNAVTIMDMGYEDAMNRMPALLASVGERRDSAYYAARREAFRAKCPPLIFGDYEITGLSRTQVDYVRDFAKVDRHSPGLQRHMDFNELKDNLYSVLASGDFLMEPPLAMYDSVSERYSFSAKLTTKPNFKVMIGGNISSTAFNQAYIGVSYETLGHVAHTFGADLYLGPLYTWGMLGGRADFYIGRPLFLDYSYNFMSKNLRHGSFGNISSATNTLQVKSGESFFSVSGGLPLTRRSVLSLRANGGHTNYHYDSNVSGASGTDHSRLSYFGMKLEVERNTLDKPLYPRNGSHLILSGIYIVGRDKFRPYDRTSFLTKRTRQWVGGRFTWDRYFDLPACRWFSFGFNVDAVYTNQPDFTTGTSTLMAFPAYAPIPQMKMIFMPDFHAKRFLAGGLMPTFDILPNFFLRTGFYAMYRNERQSGRGYNDRMHYVVEGAFVYHTAIGPVSLSLTKYDLRDWDNMYLTFNFGWAIFAPRGAFY